MVVPTCDRDGAFIPKKRRIINFIAQGHEGPAIEGELFLSHNTLKTHLRHIYAKLSVHTRAEALEMLRG